MSQITKLFIIIMAIAITTGDSIYFLPYHITQSGISIYGILLLLIGVCAFCLGMFYLNKVEYHQNGLYGQIRSAFGDYSCFQIFYAYVIAMLIIVFSIFTDLTNFISSRSSISHPFILIMVQIFFIWLASFMAMLKRKLLIICVIILFCIKFIPLIIFIYHLKGNFNLDLLIKNYTILSTIKQYSTLYTISYFMVSFIGIESVIILNKSSDHKGVFFCLFISLLIVIAMYFLENLVILGSFNYGSLQNMYMVDEIGLKYQDYYLDKIMTISHVGGIFLSGIVWMYLLNSVIKQPSLDGIFPKFLAKPFIGSSNYILIYISIVLSAISIVSIDNYLQDFIFKINDVSQIVILVPYVHIAMALRVLSVKNKNPHSKAFTIISIITIIYCFMALIGMEERVALWSFLVILSGRVFFTYGDIIVKKSGALRTQKFDYHVQRKKRNNNNQVNNQKPSQELDPEHENPKNTDIGKLD